MKKHTFLSLLTAFAMLFAFVGFTACGDDDPDPVPNPGGNTGGNTGGSTDAKISSGTLYVLEGYMPSTFEWVNFETSIEKKGDADNFVSVSADGLSTTGNLNFVTGDAKEVLLGAIKVAYVNYTPAFRVTSKKVNAFPASFTIKHKGTVKTELTEKPNFGYGDLYLFVDNNGKAYANHASAQSGQGIKIDRAQDYVTKVMDAYSNDVTVSVSNNQVTFK